MNTHRRKGLGEVEALMAVMMMECDTERVVISVRMVTIVVVVGVVGWGWQ